MDLTAEKVSELKQIIHNHLSQMNIQSTIRDALNESMREENLARHGDRIGEEDLLNMLKERGVVDDVLRQIRLDAKQTGYDIEGAVAHGIQTDRVTDAKHNAATIRRGPIDPTRRYLYFQVLSGRAFLEHLHEEESHPGQARSTFTLHINFRGQRFRSKPVPCACEPNIQEGFLLEIHKEGAGDAARMADLTSLISMSDPIHLVLIKTDPSGDTSLLSSHYIDWRSVLSADNSRLKTTLELLGIGAENKVPVGILEICLELMPKVTETLAGDVVTTQITLEKNRQSERERLFLVYAKQWWKEYLQIRDNHSQRLVKLFAQDENGTNRPVCSYIKPLKAGRLLDTPRQAARFVSLMGYERVPTLGGGEKNEQWTTSHAFLCRNKGDSEDHAVLLCSLLLGFGLDAYVCMGTKSKGAAHAWVVTIGTDGVITFWEPLTGNRYVHHTMDPDDDTQDKPDKPKHPYRTVGCIFNHVSFYANSQSSDAAEACNFTLNNESLWKAMSPDAINSVCGPGAIPSWPTLPPLCASPLDSGLISNQLEQDMRTMIIEHRKDLGLATTWDDQLSYYLTPALASYETERCTGVSAGNEEFQDAIRRAVPEGHTFKGYPIQFVHRNARRAFAACLRSPVCQEIVSCRGDHVRHALRVRIYLYPENACAAWIMFACKYKSVT